MKSETTQSLEGRRIRAGLAAGSQDERGEAPLRLPSSLRGAGTDTGNTLGIVLVMALLGVVLGLVLQGCGGGGGNGASGKDTGPRSQSDPGVGSITVLPSASSLGVGGTQQYAAVVRDTNGNILNGVTVAWASGDKGVATIDSSGLVRGLGSGTTTITASYNGITSRSVNLAVTSVPVSALTPLPPWLSYCDTEPCKSSAPVVVYACPAESPQCVPARTTTIIPQVDDKPINGIFFHSLRRPIRA